MTQQTQRPTRQHTQAQELPAEQPRKNAALARIESLPAPTMEHFSKAGYDQMRMVMIWQQTARDLDLPEFLYYMERCVVTGLDPLRKQIYAIKRKDQRSPTGYTVAHQVGIDGFRAIAQKTGAYAGSDPPEFTEPMTAPGGKKGHEVCRVTVYRIVQGVRVPFTGECRFSEYYPGDGAIGAMWQKYPHNQHAKCTEAQALRKGFPVELGEFEMAGEIGSTDGLAQIADQSMGGARELAPGVNAQDLHEISEAGSYVALYGDGEGDPPTEAKIAKTTQGQSINTETGEITDDETIDLDMCQQMWEHAGRLGIEIEPPDISMPADEIRAYHRTLGDMIKAAQKPKEETPNG